MLRDRVPGSERVQTEHLGASSAGGGGRGADGHVGWRGSVRARRAHLEPRNTTRQLHSYHILGH